MAMSFCNEYGLNDKRMLYKQNVPSYFLYVSGKLNENRHPDVWFPISSLKISARNIPTLLYLRSKLIDREIYEFSMTSDITQNFLYDPEEIMNVLWYCPPLFNCSATSLSRLWKLFMKPLIAKDVFDHTK
jgi:hypothetical protein